MKKQLVIIGIIALLVTVGLSGCEDINKNINPERNKFVGTWKIINQTFMFFSNGTCIFINNSGTWEIKDGLLVTIFPYLSTPQSIFSYVFSNSDRTVTLTDIKGGTPRVFTKQ